MSGLEDLPVVLAFTGGLVATVNPCGFAMLPAYLSFFLGLDEGAARSSRPATVTRALWVGGTVATGFVLVFGAATLLVATGTRLLTDALPWAALAVGVAVAALGVWLLTGRTLPVHLPAPGRASEGRSAGAVFTFGLAYAVASLSCTLPVFLAVVAGTATRQSLGSALAVFAVYAVGMALPLLAITVAVALGRDALVRRARAVGRHASRVGGALLVVAGAYIVVYWAVELAGVSAAPIAATVLLVERASSALTNLIGNRPLLWGGAFSSFVVLSAALGARATRRARRRERALEESSR